MYRDGGRDVVIALDASDGTTVWEYGYEAPNPLDRAGHDACKRFEPMGEATREGRI
jgi:glucose dehydrogenase